MEKNMQKPAYRNAPTITIGEIVVADFRTAFIANTRRLAMQSTRSVIFQRITRYLDVCNTFMITYQKLKEFEDDLHKHVHLENNILFPKAAEL